MKSGYRIEWSNRALRDLEQILIYLEENWSEKEIVKFVGKLHKRLNLISFFPKLYPESILKKTVRRSVLTKQVVIYFSFKDEVVKILTLFDTRQNPSRLKL